MPIPDNCAQSNPPFSLLISLLRRARPVLFSLPSPTANGTTNVIFDRRAGHPAGQTSEWLDDGPAVFWIDFRPAFQLRCGVHTDRHTAANASNAFRSLWCFSSMIGVPLKVSVEYKKPTQPNPAVSEQEDAIVGNRRRSISIPITTSQDPPSMATRRLRTGRPHFPLGDTKMEIAAREDLG